MNIVQFDWCAFVLPDDMDAFRKRYGVDILFFNGEDGTLTGLGPNDTDWRVIPSDEVEGAIIKFRSKE